MVMDISYEVMCLGLGSAVILLGILGYRWFISNRKRSLVKVNCWFCNANHRVPYVQRNSWDCPSCEQYNGFTEDGDYNKAIPGQTEERRIVGVSASCHRFSEHTNGLCVECNRNQLLKIKQLASFVPNCENNFDVEVEQYRKHLESVYKLCHNCASVVRKELSQQNSRLTEFLLDIQRRAAVVLSPKRESPAKARVRKSRRRWMKKDPLANCCHFIGFFFSLCLWVSTLHRLQEDSQNEIIGLSHVLPQFFIHLLPQLSNFAMLLVLTNLMLQILCTWRNKRSRYPIILDLLVDVSLVGAIGVFSKEISKYIISDHQDRHIWQLCISTLVCFLVWCSASVPRSKIHRKPLRKQRGKADLSVYSSICSTCSSPSPLPSLNNSCNSSPTGSGRESPMDMETCDIVSTHSALETLQIGSKIQPKFANGGLGKLFPKVATAGCSQANSVVSSMSSLKNFSQPITRKPIISPARINVSNYVPNGNLYSSSTMQSAMDWTSTGVGGHTPKRNLFCQPAFGQKTQWPSESFSRGTTVFGSLEEDSRSVISNFSSISCRRSPERVTTTEKREATTQPQNKTDYFWKFGIVAALLISLATNAVVVYFVTKQKN